MGAALLPKSVLATFPECKRLQVHVMPRGENRLQTLLIWRKGAASANVEALARLPQA